MALSASSLFLYGLEVTENNQSLDFKISALDSERRATLTPGFYSLSSLSTEIERALTEQDNTNTYTVTVDRTINSNTENRVTIETSGAFLSLLFGTGTRSASSCASLIGFPSSDQTGGTEYTGTSTAGTALVTELPGYTYFDPSFNRKVFGALNVSTSGIKEAIVWQVQQFIEVNFKYEPEAKVITDWSDFFTYAIQQRPFEFTPEVSSPNTFYDVTLETTTYDGKGLGFRLREMIPQFPFLYETGNIKMRVSE